MYIVFEILVWRCLERHMRRLVGKVEEERGGFVMVFNDLNSFVGVEVWGEFSCSFTKIKETFCDYSRRQIKTPFYEIRSGTKNAITW